MAVLAFLLGLVIVVGVIALVISLASNRPASPPRPSKIERSENAKLRAQVKSREELINRIDKIAYDNRLLDPELSFLITDAIAAHKMRELG